jgi:hypothetical protein
VFPSVTFDATYGETELEDVAARPAARLVVESTPDPLSARVAGLFVALLATETWPDRAPDAVGVNVAVTVQLAPTARDVPQVFVCE